MQPNNEATETTETPAAAPHISFSVDGGEYTVRRKAKYRVVIPGVKKPIFCSTQAMVASVLARHGRKFSTFDVHNVSTKNPKRCPMKRCARRLDGATVERI